MHAPIRCLPPYVAIAASATLAGCGAIERATHVPVHYVSHQMCTAVFVGGLDPHMFYRQGVRPVIAPVGLLMGYRIDHEKKEVRASLAGLVSSRSVFVGAEGCRVAHGNAAPAASLGDRPVEYRLAAANGGVTPLPVDPRNAVLEAALDREFAEPQSGPHRWTKSVVILHGGHIVAERYAQGYGPETPQIGWSITKSVTNALIGILVRQQRLAVDAPAPIAAWRDPKDPRHAITIDNLLRMNSGIAFGQSLYSNWLSAFDPSVQMEFDTADQAAFAETAKLGAVPGTGWNYTNGNTMLLARLIRDAAGGDAASVLRFARRELFDKLGMERVTLEFDGAGTPIGSSHMWATARDWARFGQLYLDGGVVGGERILPEGWVDYSARLTLGSETYGYGAGFWTNRGTTGGAAKRIGLGMPPDSFMARGTQGQYIVIVPSARLVVVRLGMAHDFYEDIDGVARLVAEAIGAEKKG
jgi:CubicO group peptidase (beta-lactamase class C family)